MPKAVVPVTWRLEPALYEAVRAAAQAAGLSVQSFAREALRAAVETAGAASQPAPDRRAEPTDEDRAWLEADLSRLGEFEPYEWGPSGPPQGRVVRFVPGQGLVIEDRPRG